MPQAAVVLAFLIGCGHDKPAVPHAGHVHDSGVATNGNGGAAGTGAGGHGAHGSGGMMGVATTDAATDNSDDSADAATDADDDSADAAIETVDATGDVSDDSVDAAPETGDAAPEAGDAAPEAGDAAPEAGDAAPDVADSAAPDAGAETGGPPAPACDGVLPTCAPPVPSYLRDVVPILNAKCNNCHTPGPGKPWPLDTYENVTVWAPDISDTLARCNMPPVDGGTAPLTPAEHHTIANWLACAAPDN